MSFVTIQYKFSLDKYIVYITIVHTRGNVYTEISIRNKLSFGRGIRQPREYRYCVHTHTHTLFVYKCVDTISQCFIIEKTHNKGFHS